MQGDDEDDYGLRILDDPAAVDAAAWNALLDSQARPTPFMRIEYLRALHDSGSAVPRTGWQPSFVIAEQAGQLVGGCAAYAKSHSFGEYVFDWAWADAYRRHGLRYYPKLLCAVPFTPAPGSRLLARDESVRSRLAAALRDLADRSGWSSAHALFVEDDDAAALAGCGWMLREGVQFHWTRPAEAPPADFDAYLAAMRRDKRRNIQQERRRVAEAGVSFEVLEGDAIDVGLWDFFHHCYTLTYAAHGSTPYLTRAFFAQTARDMPGLWLMFVARQHGEPIAASLLAIDRRRRWAWGRYWGATRFVPCLHFEACYYQPLQWCIANGFECFEGGAQGEHKMARGLLPVRTRSAHWLRDPRFAAAVDDFLRQERRGITHYVDELDERSPFKAAG